MGATKKRVLIICHDIVAKKMGGGGIRYFEIAKHLAKKFEVTLAIPNEPELFDLPFKLVRYFNVGSFPPLIDDCDYVFVQLMEASNVKYAVQQGKVIIYDFYNAIPIEYLGSLAFGKPPTPENDEMFKKLLSDYELFGLSGDYFVCSNERQRDFWIGVLTANGALLPTNIDRRRVEDIVGIVPFGTPEDPPKKTKSIFRGVVAGIEKEDFVVLWAGGIWDWFDPLSAIRAMAMLKDQPKIKLIFMGMTHPNKEVGRMSMADRAVKLAKELGLYKKSVFFITTWLDYSEKANYLLEADVAISTHFDSVETRFSFRTRVLDHFWAGIPSIVTQGDWFAEYIAKHDLGRVVSYENPEEIAQAIRGFYDQPTTLKFTKKRVSEIEPAFRWSASTRDLIGAIERIERPLAKNENLTPALDFNNTLVENSKYQHDIKALETRLKSAESEKAKIAAELNEVYNSRRWRMALRMSKVYRAVRGRK